MSVLTKQMYCPNCKEMKMGQRDGVNHGLHLAGVICMFIIGTIFFVGSNYEQWFLFVFANLWLFVFWPMDIFMKESKPYRCTVCGTAEKK